MADQSLQAFQIGASLFDRAQTQQRMMEQLQMQAADQVMRQRQYDLQNKIQSNAYAQTLKEQEDQANEFDAFQKFNEDVANYLNSGDEKAQIPALPRFNSKVYNQNAIQTMNGLNQYSNRAMMVKAADRARIAADRADARLFSEAADYGAFDIDTTTGAVKRDANGVPIINFKTLAEKKAQAEALARQRGELQAKGGVGEVKVEKNIQDLIDEGLLDPNDQTQLANARRAVRGSVKTPARAMEAITTADRSIYQLENALQKIDAFNAKYGPNAFNEYVGPIDNPIFKATGKFKGLTDAEKQTAKLIQQQIGMVVQDYRRGVFGATLTSNEQKNMDEIVGTPSANDYVLLAKGFNDNLKRGIGRTVSNYRFNSDIPLDIKKSYAPEIFKGQQQPQEAQTGTAAPAPSLPAGFSTPQTNQVSLPAGWGFKQ